MAGASSCRGPGLVMASFCCLFADPKARTEKTLRLESSEPGSSLDSTTRRSFRGSVSDSALSLQSQQLPLNVAPRPSYLRAGWPGGMEADYFSRSGACRWRTSVLFGETVCWRASPERGRGDIIASLYSPNAAAQSRCPGLP